MRPALTEEAFLSAIFKRDGGRCVLCRASAEIPHLLTEEVAEPGKAFEGTR
jgi:hypothetical protein